MSNFSAATSYCPASKASQPERKISSVSVQDEKNINSTETKRINLIVLPPFVRILPHPIVSSHVYLSSSPGILTLLITPTLDLHISCLLLIALELHLFYPQKILVLLVLLPQCHKAQYNKFVEKNLYNLV